jgi:hypothetical protein
MKINLQRRMLPDACPYLGTAAVTRTAAKTEEIIRTLNNLSKREVE